MSVTVSAHAPRRTYLDVMRGLAVLVMIEAHVIDSWTRAGDRATDAFGYSLILGGFGAPLFLFLAGVAVPLSAGSKARRLHDPAAAARAVMRRGFEIFLLAFLFRLQAFVLGWGATWTLLKVDILNVMGPSIVATAWLWGRMRSDRARLIGFVAATLALAFVTPAVRGAAWLAPLPDFLEGYIRPVPRLTNFAFFPWAAFVPAGAVAGLLIHNSRNAETEQRVNTGLLAGGAAIAITAYACAYLPPVAGPSYFWTSSPAFFFLRAGVMTAATGVSYFWERRPHARQWNPLAIMGRGSLFVYWIHVEMVYGLVSTPLHHALSLGGSWAGFALFSALMLAVTVLKDHIRSRVTGRGRPTPAGLQITGNLT